MANPKTKQRMTAQSKVNIKYAKQAFIIPSTNGYKVQLVGQNGTGTVDNANGPIEYGSMSAAKNAVKTHNQHLTAELKPTI